jgi:hypothetical protein
MRERILVIIVVEMVVVVVVVGPWIGDGKDDVAPKDAESKKRRPFRCSVAERWTVYSLPGYLQPWLFLLLFLSIAARFPIGTLLFVPCRLSFHPLLHAIMHV